MYKNFCKVSEKVEVIQIQSKDDTWVEPQKTGTFGGFIRNYSGERLSVRKLWK